MINIIKKEIDVEESLKKRLEIICDFCNTTPTIINGSIRKVDKTNDEYKNIQTLSVTLNNVDTQIQENHKQIQTLTENNEALSLRVKTLEKSNNEKDKEILSLKNKIFSLSNTIDYWKNKFEKLINFLHSKLHNWIDKDDKYIDVVNDMYQDNVLDDEDINDLDLNKEKDDFEM